MLLGTFPLGTLPLGIAALLADVAPDGTTAIRVVDNSGRRITVTLQSMFPRGPMTDDFEHVSGLDDLRYSVTLTDEATGAALTSGTVTMVLAQRNTTTSLGSGATKALTHAGSGVWAATHDFSDFVAVLPGVGGRFDRVLTVSGAAARLLARCKRVAIVDETAAAA